jgi:hypothetical protein
MPAASPTIKLEQKIGLTDFTLLYARPSMRGRTIFGDLVPFGEVWRTGANASTKLTFSDAVSINYQNIAAGTYALYSIPGKTEWTVIISKNTELWGSMGYNDADDVTRFTVAAVTTQPTVETFTIDLANMGMDVVHLQLRLENAMIEFPIKAEVHSKVMAQIKEQVIDGNSQNAGMLFQAATYYFDSNQVLNQVLAWVSRSIEIQPQYWVLHLKAKIEAKLGLKTEAIASATQSMEMAKAANNPDYIRPNEALIKGLK